jgi:hypothetical protein
MTFKELKVWVNNLPEEFDEFSVVNGEFKEIDEQYWYRIDKPVTMLTVDQEHREILILNDEDPDDVDILDDGEPEVTELD